MKYIVSSLLAILLCANLLGFHGQEINNLIGELDKKEEKLLREWGNRVPKENYNYIEDTKRLLTLMYELDQKARQFLTKQGVCSNFLTKLFEIMERIDNLNLKFLKILLIENEWISISKFGEIADNHAWLLVQHADNNIEFQTKALGILEQMYQQGETAPKHYGYLFDRVAKNRGKPQRYGTQGVFNKEGVWVPNSIENPHELNDRRTTLIMGSFEDYIDHVNRMYSNKP